MTVRNFFFKTIVVCLAIFGIVIGGSSLLLPRLASEQLESHLQDRLHPEGQSLRVESSPGIKLAFGDIDTFRGDLDGVNLGQLRVQRLHFDLRQMKVSPTELYMNQRLQFTNLGKGHIEAVIHQDDLKQFIEQRFSDKNANALSIETVDVTNRGVIMEGHINVGGFLSGKLILQGQLEIEGNTLQFATEKLSIGGSSLHGLSNGAVKSIPVYNFNDFPIPVVLDRVETGREEIHVYVHPVEP